MNILMACSDNVLYNDFYNHNKIFGGKMKKIYLFCSFGMSTSLLAKKMQSVADKHELPLEIKAFTVNEIEDIVAAENPDCILLGPQVKHQLAAINEKLGANKAPVGLISKEDYGLMAGDKVLRQAVDLIKEAEG
jgi:PTS system cellobiose-specific IIB component